MTERIVIGSGRSLTAVATPDGILFTEGRGRGSRQSDALMRFEGRLPVLEDNGFVDRSGADLLLSYEQMANLEEEDRVLADALAPSAPFSVALQDRAHLGSDEFRIDIEFLLGAKELRTTRVGPFLECGGTVYQLPSSVYEVVRDVEKINQLPNQKKKDLGSVLRLWGRAREHAIASGASLSSYLDEERVILADSVAPTFQPMESGGITVVPEIPGAPSDQFVREYLSHAGVPDRYSVRDPGGKRVRIVLSSDVKTVLEAWNRMRRLSRRERDELLCNPTRLIPEGITSETVDLSGYGPRVRAIGEYPSSVRPYVTTGQNWVDIDEVDEAGRSAPPADAGVLVQFPDGESRRISFDDPAQAAELARRVECAVDAGEPTVEFRGVNLPATSDLAEALREVEGFEEREAEGPDGEVSPKPSRPRGKGLLIFTNEEVVEFTSPAASREPVDADSVSPPESLSPQVELKPHQQAGFAWLKHSFTSGRNGVLLADDMGLGKTLQTLTFLAWLIEEDPALGLGASEGPWDPILIVAPPTLLSVWTSEIRKFFEPSLFMPHEVLTTESARKMRVSGGRESSLGRPVLEVGRLQQNRLVLTSYQTLAAYGLSLGQINWSVVVADEAQAIKDPNTRTSIVFKALKSSFRIALTGTPVETRLLDVWNIFDALEPGLLGSAKEFSSRYEPKDGSGRIMSAVPEARELAARIGVAGSGSISRTARLLRRSKEDELPELPTKKAHLIESTLGADQRSMYVSLVKSLRQGRGPGSALKLLIQLNRVCQHPRLLGGEVLAADPDSLAKESPKLESLLHCLDRVARRGEKALIFAHFRDAQAAIKRVVDARFGIDAPILNGDREGGTRQVHRARMAMIERFESQPGFHAMVVSPRVGGVGLTITAANHVFHYGRWWNPAREDQCTDRVYRIGQDRDVHVYRLVAKDPLGKFRTFDERLDELLESRREAAESFLVPQGDEGRFGEDLANSLRDDPEEESADDQREAPIISAAEVAALGPDAFEAACAAILEAEGYEVYLTPFVNDGGIDVVAINSHEVILVQAKHTASGHILTNSVLDEMDNGELIYREKVIPKPLLLKRALRVRLFTNSPGSRRLMRDARSRDMQAIMEKELLKRIKRNKIRRSDIGRWEANRLQRLQDLMDSLVGQ